MDTIKKIPVILDGDPGHDDAIAWVLAKSSPLLDIRACTSVCGNQTIEKTTYNALRICTLIGNHAPFGVGRPRPLVAEPIVVPTVHGKSGLDGPVLPEPDFEPCGLDAPALMEKVIEESDEPVTIVPTGPLTNVAALLLTRPDLKDKIARISLMGGGIAYGNWTPAAEFNILVDPEAAKIVFESGMRRRSSTQRGHPAAPGKQLARAHAPAKAQRRKAAAHHHARPAAKLRRAWRRAGLFGLGPGL